MFNILLIVVCIIGIVLFWGYLISDTHVDIPAQKLKKAKAEQRKREKEVARLNKQRRKRRGDFFEYLNLRICPECGEALDKEIVRPEAPMFVAVYKCTECPFHYRTDDPAYFENHGYK
jgi:hypothetical protein